METDRWDALKKCISEKEAAKRSYDDYAFEPYIPCFQRWLGDTLEAEAERLSRGQPLAEYRQALEGQIESLIEQIMPDREFDVAMAIANPDGRVNELAGGVHWGSDMDGEMHWRTVKAEDGSIHRLPASDYQRAVYGLYGLWERLVEDAHVHLLRSQTRNAQEVREHLREAGRNRLMPLLARHQLALEASGPTTRVTLSQQLKAARAAKGLSQRVAAGRLGITRNSLQGHESGKVKPTGGALRKYKKLYGADFSAE